MPFVVLVFIEICPESYTVIRLSVIRNLEVGKRDKMCMTASTIIFIHLRNAHTITLANNSHVNMILLLLLKKKIFFFLLFCDGKLWKVQQSFTLRINIFLCLLYRMKSIKIHFFSFLFILTLFSWINATANSRVLLVWEAINYFDSNALLQCCS